MARGLSFTPEQVSKLVIGENMAGEELPNIGADGKIDTYGEPLRCPFCGDDDLHTDSVEHEHNHVYKHIMCYECGATWVEDYVFDAAYTTN